LQSSFPLLGYKFTLSAPALDIIGFYYPKWPINMLAGSLLIGVEGRAHHGAAVHVGMSYFTGNTENGFYWGG
jgi:hypothetical protein